MSDVKSAIVMTSGALRLTASQLTVTSRAMHWDAPTS